MRLFTTPPLAGDIPSYARYRVEFNKWAGGPYRDWPNRDTARLMERLVATPRALASVRQLAGRVLGTKGKDEWWRVREFGRNWWETIERNEHLTPKGAIAWWAILDYFAKQLWDDALASLGRREEGDDGQVQERNVPDAVYVYAGDDVPF